MSRHPFGQEGKFRPRRGRTQTAAAKTKAAERLKAADARASARYRIVSFFERLCRAADAEQRPRPSMRQGEALIRQAIAEGNPALEGVAKITKTMLHRLLTSAAAKRDERKWGEFALADGKRKGRTPKGLPGQLQDVLREQLVLAPDASVPRLTEHLTDVAAEFGVPKPSEHQVETFIEAIPDEELSAAIHGRRAGVIDYGQKGTIPTDFPHHVWTLDELDVPVFFKAWHPAQRKLVGVMTKMILFVDNHTRAIPSYYVVPPFKGGRTAIGYDATDIVGAFYGGALVDLAPAACKEFAGCLPHVVRMDNHPTHPELKKLLKRHGVECPDLPSRMPHPRGMVEALVGRTKEWCADIRGYDDRYEVAASLTQDPRARRSAAAATLTRARRKTLIAVEDLLSFDQLCAEIDRVIAAYHDRRHSILGQTPRGAYHERLQQDAVRAGHEAIRWLDPLMLTVRPDAVWHAKSSFATWTIGERLIPGRQYQFRADPLKRGLYVVLDDLPFFLPPLADAARDIDPVALSRARSARARETSLEATETRKQHHEADAGSGAVGRAEAEAEAAISAARELGTERGRARRQRTTKDAERAARERGESTEAPPRRRRSEFTGPALLREAGASDAAPNPTYAAALATQDGPSPAIASDATPSSSAGTGSEMPRAGTSVPTAQVPPDVVRPPSGARDDEPNTGPAAAPDPAAGTPTRGVLPFGIKRGFGSRQRTG